MSTATALALLFTNNTRELTLVSESITGASWYADGSPPQALDPSATTGGYGSPGSADGYTAEFAYTPDGGVHVLTLQISVSAGGGITTTPTSAPPYQVTAQSTQEPGNLWLVTTTYTGP